MSGRLGGEKKLIWLEFDSILVKLWNETFKNKYILQSLVLYCILEVLLPRNQRYIYITPPKTQELGVFEPGI